MPTIADARAAPSIAVYWVKNNILAAIISAAVSLILYALRHAVDAADADAGFGAVAVLYVSAAILWAISGGASGLLTGAVLQRIAPLLPARTWIGLHAAIGGAVGLGSEVLIAISSGDTRGTDDATMVEVLLVGSMLGALIGAAGGGLEALVLRAVAFGAGAWAAWTTAAYAIAVSLFAVIASLWDTGGGLAGELANDTVVILCAVVMSLVMLPALRRLKNPLLVAASGHFT